MPVDRAPGTSIGSPGSGPPSRTDDHRTGAVSLPEFSISTASLGACELLTVRGELDSVTAQELAGALDAARGRRPIVLDVSELDFIDSGGVHVIIQRASGPDDLRLVCPDGSNVSRVLSIVRIEQVMSVYERLDDALGDLTG